MGKLIFFSKRRPISGCDSENLRKEIILLNFFNFRYFFLEFFFGCYKVILKTKNAIFCSQKIVQKSFRPKNQSFHGVSRLLGLRHFFAKWRILAYLLTPKLSILGLNGNFKMVEKKVSNFSEKFGNTIL